MNAPHNPYSAPTARIVDPDIAPAMDPRRVEHVRIGQRWVNITFLVYLMLLAASRVAGLETGTLSLVALAGYLLLIIGGAVGLGRIGTGMQTHIVLRVLSVILLLVPFPAVPLLVLALSSARATRFLRKAGLKVGLLGARKP